MILWYISILLTTKLCLPVFDNNSVIHAINYATFILFIRVYHLNGKTYLLNKTGTMQILFKHLYSACSWKVFSYSKCVYRHKQQYIRCSYSEQCTLINDGMCLLHVLMCAIIVPHKALSYIRIRENFRTFNRLYVYNLYLHERNSDILLFE